MVEEEEFSFFVDFIQPHNFCSKQASKRGSCHKIKSKKRNQYIVEQTTTWWRKQYTESNRLTAAAKKANRAIIFSWTYRNAISCDNDEELK
jgi:hypothetical protein